MIATMLLLALAAPSDAKTLANGLSLTTLQVPGDVVTVALVLEGGTAADGRDHGESLLAHTLFFGQGDDFLRESFRKELLEQGARLDVDVRPDNVIVSITGLASQLEQIVGLLAIATIPVDLVDRDFQRARNAIVDGLWELRRSSVRRAVAQIPELVFGGAHPYGHLPSGDRRTLGRLSVAKIKAHLGRTLCPSRARLVVSGDVTMPKVERLVAEDFSSWKRCRKPVEAPGVAFEPLKRFEVRGVHDGHRTQVTIVAGLAVPLSRPEDVPALEMAVDVLGGSLSSRLQSNLRQRDGLTYGASAAVDVRRGAGVVYVHTPVDAKRVDEALRSLIDTFDGLAASPFTGEELERARRRRSSHRASAARSTELRIRRWLTGSDAAEPSDDDVRRVAAAMKSDALQIVVVGSRRKLTPQLEAMKLGRVRFVR